jgi:hypothetical protein
MGILTTGARAAAALDAILLNINHTAGPTAGTVKLYTGSAPANVAAGATGTLLATLTLIDGSQNAFGATNISTLTATGYTAGSIFAQDTSPVASGTIGYWRMLDYTGVAVLQGSVSVTGGGGDITWNSLSVTAGILVKIITMTVTISGIV